MDEAQTKASESERRAMVTKLLLVEDDQTLRETLAYNLTREGYEVTQAGDGVTVTVCPRKMETGNAARAWAMCAARLA